MLTWIKSKKRWLGILIASLCIISIYMFNQSEEVVFNAQGGIAYTTYEKAKVLQIISENLEKDQTISGLYRGAQQIEVKLLTGEYKGNVHTITNYLSTLYNVHAKAGQTLIVSVDTAGPSIYDVSVYNYYRAPILYLLIGIFLGFMWLIGGQKGLKSVVGLLFTVACLIFVFLPMLYRGYSPINASILIVILTTCVTLLVLDGWTKKAWAAILGTTAGVIIAGSFSSLFGGVARISGFNTPEAETLIVIAYESGMQIKGLLFAGILIAALGAIMDVAITIASSIQEVHTANPTLSKRELFWSGINVGRDMMGTMANTLILAFAGASLTSLLLIYSYHVPYHQLMSMDLIVIEIIQSISGSIGIILTVPIVAAISSTLLTYKK